MSSVVAQERVGSIPRVALLHRLKGRDVLQGGLSITAEERKFLERVIERELLGPNELAPLIDGDAFPSTYGERADAQPVGTRHIRWGRLVKHQSVHFSFKKVERTTILAEVTRAIEGVMKVAAPFHLSRRKRYGILCKPFREVYRRSAFFRRIAFTNAAARDWTLDSVSLGVGGTENSPLFLKSVVFHDGGGMRRTYEVDNVERMGLRGGEGSIPVFSGGKQIRLQLTLHSVDMEPNIVVLRGVQENGDELRQQLQFLADHRNGAGFIQHYEATMIPASGRNIQQIVVEGVDRSSLYDPGAPVHTNFWVFSILAS